MFPTDAPQDYRARADMHEQLAAATEDLPARKMHLAMAAAYRRKAGEQGEAMVEAAPAARLIA